jgi:hypothetical protein
MSAAPSVEVTIPRGYERNGSWSRVVRLRRWSSREEIDFEEHGGSLTPAARSTALLAACMVEPAGVDFVRGLVAGDRVALLLHLRRLTIGDELACVVECPDCGTRLDVDLAVSDLLLPPYAEPRSLHEMTAGTASIRFRLPNGEDLEHCGELFRLDKEAAIRLLLQRCVRAVNGNAYDDGSPPWLAERVGEEMASLDPQAELRMTSTCPACKRALGFILDVPAFMLEEIRHRGRRLLREVHILASAYHWSEGEILGMPEKRRRHYLSLIDGGAQ